MPCLLALAAALITKSFSDEFCLDISIVGCLVGGLIPDFFLLLRGIVQMWPRLMSETFEALKEKNSKNITILAYKTVHIIEKDNMVKRSKHAYSDDQIHKQIAAVELKIYFTN